jgi:hypothetical protein
MAIRKFTHPGPPAIPTDLFYFLVTGWTRVHGMVMLELFHHTQDVISDPEAFYTHEVDALLESLTFRGIS